MNKHYIAVDIGASSGRLMLANLENGKMTLTEIHRFKNGFKQVAGHDRWDIDHLGAEIIAGLAKVKQAGIDEVTLGIDTWAVDYVLVDEAGYKLADPISYRDCRTKDAISELTAKISKEEIYRKTGIQFQEFNTLYQLYREDQALLKQAAKIMLVPDYLGYMLTGKAVTEVTNASTTQMLNLRAGLFDSQLLSELGLQADKFAPLVDAGTYLGPIKAKLRTKYDLPQVRVVTVASHDTASAVVGTPAVGDNWAFLSSGTWSLLGTELKVPENGPQAYQANYTNEWGAYGTYRFLKNIMGMWMVQCIAKEYQGRYSFSQLAQLASQVEPCQQFIDVNDDRFLNPPSMIEALQAYCHEHGQKVPQSPGELVMAVYSNLALYYADQLSQLGQILGKQLTTLNIVGGGSNVALLNQLTADLAGIKVIAGPSEATAVGNILVAMITDGELADLPAARKLVRDSFALKTYQPKHDYAQALLGYQHFKEELRWQMHKQSTKPMS